MVLIIRDDEEMDIVPSKAFLLFALSEGEEDLDKLFWGFQYVWAAWCFFLQKFGISYAVQRTFNEFLLHMPFKEKECFS